MTKLTTDTHTHPQPSLAGAPRGGPFLVFDCAEKSVAAGELELFGAEETALASAPQPTRGMPGILELAGGVCYLPICDFVGAWRGSWVVHRFRLRRL